LNQIAWQAQGIEAILDPEVMTRLDFSPEQLNSIGATLNMSRDRLASLQMNTEIRPESRRLAYLRNLRAEAERSVLATLNSHQRRALSTLMGRPFDLSRVREIACEAPEFEAETWLNSPPLKMADLKGKVTVIHFYAFGCGNCIRNLPHYNDWHNRFAASGLQIIGIHRPETQRERDVEKVKEKAAEAGIDYPVVIDNESLCWDSWANRVWPSIYLLDRNGFVRYWWYGELNWQGAESEKLMRTRIEELIAEQS
jgi:peroxiredoxin